jgi:hypothetical protein
LSYQQQQQAHGKNKSYYQQVTQQFQNNKQPADFLPPPPTFQSPQQLQAYSPPQLMAPPNFGSSLPSFPLPRFQPDSVMDLDG